MAIRGILALLTLGITAVVADGEQIAVAHLTPHNIEKYNVTGDLKFTQATPGGPVVVTGTIYGLSEGLHGFHVHQTGDLSNGCLSALGHFNPDNLTHGAPEDAVRHIGDLGNIEATSDRIANVYITDNKISLSGRTSILGRSIVVHALVDDLGKGGHELSLSTGNAGDRAACGVIGILGVPEVIVSDKLDGYPNGYLTAETKKLRKKSISKMSPVDEWNSNSGGSIFWSSSKFLVTAGMVTLFIQAKF